MSNYPNTTLTNAGQDLIAESIAEGKALIFTKVELGDGNLTAGQSISTLTALISSKMNVPLSSGSADNGQAKLRFAVGNSGLEEGFFAREVGVFAKVGQTALKRCTHTRMAVTMLTSSPTRAAQLMTRLWMSTLLRVTLRKFRFKWIARLI